jgi:hypothetical protein
VRFHSAAHGAAPVNGKMIAMGKKKPAKKAAKSAKKAAHKSAKKAAKSATKIKTKTAASKQGKAKTAAKQSRFKSSELTRVRGHVSSRTRRDQAKRDGKP